MSSSLGKSSPARYCRDGRFTIQEASSSRHTPTAFSAGRAGDFTGEETLQRVEQLQANSHFPRLDASPTLPSGGGKASRKSGRRQGGGGESRRHKPHNGDVVGVSSAAVAPSVIVSSTHRRKPEEFAGSSVGSLHQDFRVVSVRGSSPCPSTSQTGYRQQTRTRHNRKRVGDVSRFQRQEAGLASPEGGDIRGVPGALPNHRGIVPRGLAGPRILARGTDYPGGIPRMAELDSKPSRTQPTARQEFQGRGAMMTQGPSLVTRGSTYVNVSLNASAEELTLVSYNIQMLVDCCSLSVNWWSRERQLIPYLRKIYESYRPDVIVFEECWSPEALRLIRLLAKDTEAPFPYQTRILGADSGPPCNCPDCGDCYCTCCQCCECLRCPCCCCCPCCCIPRSSRYFGARRGGGGTRRASSVSGHQDDNVPRLQTRTESLAPPPPPPGASDAWNSVSGNYMGTRRNGGVVIISRWPILQRHAYIYHHSAMPDSLENKGAVLVRIDKGGKIYNVVGTHLQSGESNNNIRVAQAKELAAWLRTGMEECERTEFASAEADGSGGSSGGEEGSSGTRRKTGRRHGGNAVNAEVTEGECRVHAGGGLPTGLLKATEPLIIAGDFNLRYKEDHEFLMQAIRPDNLNCSLCIGDPANPPTSYDTELNDCCYYNNGKPKVPIKQLIDFFLLSNDHFGSVSRCQQTITMPADHPMSFRFFKCLCIPVGSTKIHHVSDHLPICVTIRHNKET
ncbi:endonuclease exonuclease phosphatase domain-containing [Cystoisospora suis]|uniref:Endonuclease exonuclease phosphatase domain-containing n=1 Tax=Cystoisospora suis TaxID=483139 RepID=A0A2C6LAV0_9APIC|nr:endonuclease exonuclease phosphatase domain-containing [Cystoisospora suis]